MEFLIYQKFLKVIGSFFLVLIIIFACVFIWFGINSSKYTEEAKPYLDTNIPVALSWDFEQLKPLLTPESLEAFETERGQKVYKMFSKLGAKTGVTTSSGAFDIVNFSMPARFEAGDAQVSVTLALVDESYKIHYLHINSDAFLE